MKKKLFLVLFIALLGICSTNAQVCRGPTQGELYITARYMIYYEGGEFGDFAILIHSDNYGRNFTQKYLYQYDSGNTLLGQVLADATPEVLYNIVSNKYTNDPEKWGLYRSINDGESWEFVSDLYSPNELFATGNIEDEIFRKSQGVIYKSEDNGENWTQMQEDVVGKIEVGNQPGEIYVRTAYGNDPYEITIHHSTNDGVDFDSYIVDSTITGYQVSGKGPTISRGAIPGELYLTTWWHSYKYKIFRSTDHGQNFTFQYEQPDTWVPWDEGYHFTAGRNEGEFYVIKRKIIETNDGVMTRLHVFHSNDYAQNFSEYVHILDDTYNGNPIQVIHTIATTVNPAGGGTVEGSGKYDEGEEVSLIATPAEGYNFINWTENDSVVSDEPEYSFIAESTRTLKANFQLESYNIITEVNPAEGGTVNGTGQYYYGTTAELTATPNTNFTFLNWTENGEVVAETEIYSFEVTGNRELTANFQLLNNVSYIDKPEVVVFYPNPCTEQVTIIIPGFLLYKNPVIEIFNIYGQRMKNLPIKEEQIQIDISGLPSGTYLYRFTDGRELLKTGKIIIN